MVSIPSSLVPFATHYCHVLNTGAANLTGGLCLKTGINCAPARRSPTIPGLAVAYGSLEILDQIVEDSTDVAIVGQHPRQIALQRVIQTLCPFITGGPEFSQLFFDASYRSQLRFELGAQIDNPCRQNAEQIFAASDSHGPRV